MAKVLAEVTMFPGQPVEVDEDELEHLRREGLLIEQAPAAGSTDAGEDERAAAAAKPRKPADGEAGKQ